MAQSNDTITSEYCEVVSISKNMTSVTRLDANIFINFGGGVIYNQDTPMKDKDGNLLMFTDPVDCLNYLGLLNWKLGQTNIFYQQNGMSQRTVTRYTLSRPKFGIKK